MTHEEYLKYDGLEAHDSYANRKGIICGFYLHDDTLIMRCKNGWPTLASDAIVFNKKKDDKYWHVQIPMIISIIREDNSIANNNAEKYVKTNFPNISDDDADIYINIFIAGANSVKS